MKSKIERAAWLESHLDAMRNAGPIRRPYTFATRMDRTIAAETWQHFEPAVPLDAISLIYAGVGALIGLFFYLPSAAAVKLPARIVTKRRSAKIARERIAPRVQAE